MEYVNLGATGLRVSRICLGLMSYGRPGQGNQPWSLDRDDAAPFFRQAVEAGITFFDTANVYSAGSSEEITGETLWELAPRDEIVLATKVHGRMHDDPNGQGLSRKAILREIDASLRRLRTDYIDLYQIHRWDPHTPLEETLDALDSLVRAGKVRYLGASSMFAWQFAKALFVADQRGASRFVSMQNHYNLLYREEEREMMPLLADQGVASIPWSPLARGRLTRPWGTVTGRSQHDVFGANLYHDSDQAVVAATLALAERRGISPAQVALAWVLSHDVVASPIVGATKAHHLADAVAALDVHLTPEEIAELEAPYVPHPVAGHQ